MSKPVTIVITPRDRYSELTQCLKDIYSLTSEQLFDLIVLDLGYPAKDLDPARDFLKGKSNYRIIDYGRIIPMEAMARVRDEIKTRYAFFMDNDSRPLAGWLEPLLETAEQTGAAVINPVTLEKSGVDEGAEIRNHLFTTELRQVEVEGSPYLIEFKSYRRALPEELPDQIADTQAFELHGVMFRTDALQHIEIPRMTIREHLDIGMQLRIQGQRLVVDPRSRILFDNLGTRGSLSDLRYFNLRWNGRITADSSRLFEKRWGYKFYSEQAIYNWAIRRRLFLLLRWMHLPIPVANKIDRVFFGLRRRLFPIWDPLPDPFEVSRSFYDQCKGGVPVQLDHATR